MLQVGPLGYTDYFLYFVITENFDESIAAWEEAIKLQPDSPDAHTSACLQFQQSNQILALTLKKAWH